MIIQNILAKMCLSKWFCHPMLLQPPISIHFFNSNSQKNSEIKIPEQKRPEIVTTKLWKLFSSERSLQMTMPGFPGQRFVTRNNEDLDARTYTRLK
jgi:hypothetical protein